MLFAQIDNTPTTTTQRQDGTSILLVVVRCMRTRRKTLKKARSWGIFCVEQREAAAETHGMHCMQMMQHL